MPSTDLDLNTSALMRTELAYLSDTYLMNAQSTCLSVEHRDDGLLGIQLDRTIFYPKGGGQPCDTGTISFARGVLEVRSVVLSELGIVSHLCTLTSGEPPSPSDKMDLHVCEASRLNNARNHTAGHLIDLAVQLLPYRRAPVKANHSPTESWVQFSGDHLPIGETTEDVKRALTDYVNGLVHANLRVTQFVPVPEEIVTLGVSAPPGKFVRLVAFEGHESLARGCGGTHVRTTGEVGNVAISGVRARKGVLSVTYGITTNS